MKNLAVTVLTLALTGATAWADGTGTTVASLTTNTTTTDATAAPVVNQSVTTTDKTGESALSLDKFYASFYGNLEGGRLSDVGPYEANPTTGQMTKQAMTLASTATIAYMATPDIGIGTYLEMNITPVFGQGWEWLDAGLTIFDRKLVNRNGLTISANFIAELPTDSYDINRGMIAGIETTPSIRYEIPNSRFSLGAWTEVKNYTGSTSGKILKTYYEPYVAYSIIPQLSLNVTYEFEYDHFAGTSGMQVYETDIQPGLLYFITPKIMINPYVMWFTNNRLTADTACFGAALVARVL